MLAATDSGENTIRERHHMKCAIVSDKGPAPAGPYSPGLSAGDFVFVSGQGPFHPETKAMGDTIEEQTRQTLENVKSILEAGGAGMADVVKVTVLMTDLGEFQRMNKVYEEFFPKPAPTRTTFGVGLAIAGMKIEIDAIAYVGK